MKNKLPEGWKEVELGEICEIKKGSPITKDKVVNGKIPVIAGGQQPAYFHNESNRSGETITVSGSGAYAGFVAYFDKPIFASDCSTIQVKSKGISCKYIYLLLKSQQKRIYNLQRGIAQPHVYPKDLIKLKIPLPPLSVQQKIVSILEKAEAAKELRKQADELTDTFLKAVFYEMFGNGKKFEEVELGNKKIYEEFFAGGDVPKNRLSYNKTDNYNIPIYTNGEKNKGFYGYTDKARVTKESLTISARGTIGYSEIRKEPFFPAIRLIVITPKKNILNLYYLKYAIDNIKFELGATSIPQLTVPECKKLKIPLPPLSLQQKFASIVQEVEAIKEQQKKSKEYLDDLFNALMQKAFKGELIA